MRVCPDCHGCEYMEKQFFPFTTKDLNGCDEPNIITVELCHVCKKIMVDGAVRLNQ